MNALLRWLTPHPLPPVRAPNPRVRLLAVVAVGALLSAFSFVNAVIFAHPRDFDQVLAAARFVLQGRNPYDLVGPGKEFAFTWPLYYPLPAALLAMPLAPLDRVVANAFFIFVGVTLLGFTLTRHSLAPLLGGLSAAVFFAAHSVQWSPLLAAALGLPALGVAFIAKPTIGAAIFAARPSWWPIVGGTVLTAVAFLLQPDWLVHWRDVLSTTTGDPRSTQATPYVAPALLPGGALALFAALRWRRPEARLVAALACVPQTTLLYEAVPLFLVPRSAGQAIYLTVSSYLVLLWAHFASPFADYQTRYRVYGQAMVLLLYLPCVVMILRRPNEGPAPLFLERWLARIGAPAWLRGTRREPSAEPDILGYRRVE